MFHVRLVARPDARMVEVPLEIEAALPRDFDGVVMLASSGLPRKVKLKAPSDALKLSTAYRLERMLGDIVRLTLRGTVQDNARVQDAARAYIKGVRERRSDGATLLVVGDGRGKIDVSSAAAPSPLPEAPPKAAAAPAPSAPAAGSSGPAVAAPPWEDLADRIAALERKIASLEPDGGDLGAARTPRQPTALDAFAEGLRTELRARATQMLGSADRSASACDRARALAADAARDLGCDPEGDEQRDLRRLAAEAQARQAALQRFVGELETYAAADLVVADRLLERLSDKQAAPGALSPDPGPALARLAEGLLRTAPAQPALVAWMESALPLCEAMGPLLARVRPAAPGSPSEDLVVSDRDVEEIHDLRGLSGKPSAPGGGPPEDGAA